MGQVEYSQVQMGRYCLCFGARKGKKLRSDREEVPTPEIKPHFSCEFSRELSVIADDPSTRYKVQTFTYRELATATRNFRKECLLGQGGFGSVYKGILPGTQEVVAVKQLDHSGFQGDKEFLVEVLMLTLLRHPNLVNLIGYSAEGDQRLLVYEYMPLGSLDDHLHELGPNQDPLDWNTRMMIAAGAAKGLEYLHTGADPPVIYRDIKSSNILLDEGFHPKLSDFGLAKFGPVGDKSHVSTRIMGTHGYCAPEYFASGKLTMKSDIYSFGVFLFELLTGRRVLDNTYGRDKILVDWVRHVIKDGKSISELVDPLLEGRFSKSTAVKYVEVAFMCIHEKAISRPCINEVTIALDYLASHPYTPKGVKRVGAMEAESYGSPKEMEMDKERDRAVAEAKLWGQTYLTR